jgi:Acyl-CoA thioesterase C-terminal domain/Acyl-CoA thioesterase N-terminal domain
MVEARLATIEFIEGGVNVLRNWALECLLPMSTPPACALPPFFVPDGEAFVATESTRGPWSRQHQHGGPPSALLARAMEQLAGDGALLSRLTFDFLRPVPIAPLTVRAELTRTGAKVRRLQATLSAADGRPLVQASAVALRTAPILPESVGNGDLVPAPPEAATPFEFRFFADAIGYHTSVETRITRGSWGKGPVAAWMRSRVPLVAGETPSPLQRLLIVADSASGVAVVVDYTRYTFVNADLTVALHRPAEGDWIGLDASTVAEAHGVGLTRARLWDTRGALGVSLQSCLVEPRPA